MFKIFYFRGLNTYGDECLHLGPYVAGTHHGPITEAFKQHDLHLHPVLGMEAGPLQKIIHNAKKSLLAMPEWNSCNKAVFLGHSTGALVARALANDEEISQKVKLVLSIGGPHQGCNGADRAIEWAKKPTVTVFFCRMTGWNLKERIASIENLSVAQVKEFNENFPLKKEIRYASWLCQEEFSKLSWAMKFMARRAHRDENKNWINQPSDGLVFIESQKLGEILGESNLDHLSMIGYFFFLKKRDRQRHKIEFQKMVSGLAAYLQRQNF